MLDCCVPAFSDTHHTGFNDRQDRLDVACKAVKFSSGDTTIQWCLVIDAGKSRHKPEESG